MSFYFLCHIFIFFILDGYTKVTLRLKAKVNGYDLAIYQQKLNSSLTFMKIFKYSIFSSLMTFSVSNTLISTFNLASKFVYEDRILGGNVGILVTSYHALLPYVSPFVIGITIGIAILDWGDYFYMFKDEEGNQIRLENRSMVIRNYFKGFVGISTFFTLIQIVISLYWELAQVYSYLSPTYMLNLMLFIGVYVPFLLFPIFLITDGLLKYLTD